MSGFLVPAGVGVLLLIVLVATGYGAARPYRHVLLGVTLPQEAQRDAAVAAIVRRYTRGLLLLAGLALAALLPLYALRDHASLNMLYMLAWFAGVLAANGWITRGANRRLGALKAERHWLAGAASATVVVDTAVSRVKQTMPLSPLWFVPALAIALIPALLIAHGGGDPLAALAGPGLILLLFFIRHGFVTRRMPAYCRDSAVNLACARVEQRGWSVCFTAAAYGLALATLLTYLLPGAGPSFRLAGLLLTGAALCGVILGVLFTFLRVRRQVERLLSQVPEPLYLDEDRHWRGPFYYNPQDPRVRVEKRYGVGFTYNLATRGGKALCLGLAVLLAVSLTGGLGPLLALDTGGIRLSVTGGAVVIDAPLYGTRFDAADITDITQIDALPDGQRTNGIGTGRYSVGHYRLDGFGDCLVYVDKRQTPVLVIALPDETIFVNGASSAETQRYRALLEAERASAARSPGRTADG